MIPEWNSFINADCMEYLKEFPDNYFDLAICDPPYGGGASANAKDVFKNGISGRFGGRFANYLYTEDNKELGTHFHGRGRSKKYKEMYQPEIKVCRTGGDGGGWKNSTYGKNINYWDIAPSEEYFEQLFRVSKNQIIWGGNYFYLPPTRCFIIWEKTNIPENFTMSMCEYAWTSFNANAKIYKHTSYRDNTSGKFHPTEKPIDLYEWLLQQYAKDGETILDTHVGSASSLIACRRTNHKYIGFEIDEIYYQQAKKRLDAETAQVNVFDLI